MAGTISFGGIGSGMDTEGIVTGLVSASSGSLNTLKTRANSSDSAVSSLSSISTLLSTLKKNVDALSSATGVGSYSATSSNSAVAVSANGTAQPGAYKIEVSKLAREQRNYSKEFASSTNALGQTGILSLKVGTADAINLDIEATDSLENIVSKINASGGRFSAAIFNDGTNYRLQLRGLDTGTANAITIGETGVDFGLNTPTSMVQSAQNAELTIDGFAVTRPTNQVVGAIQGVTLALTTETTAPLTVQVQNDPDGLTKKMQSVVDSYNAIVNKIHGVAGYGSTTGTEAALRGDSSLRSITTRLSDSILKRVTGAGTYDTAGAIGLSIGKTGLLSLDASKLSTALSKDSNSVTNVLAGVGSGSGVMDLLSNFTTDVTSSRGALATRKESLEARAKTLRDAANREQDRLDRYADSLRKQFTAMDSVVATNQSDLSYLTRLYG